MVLNNKVVESDLRNRWHDSVIPKLCEFIKIPNKSPAFDENWEQNGHIENALSLVKEWCEQQNIANTTINVERIKGETPLLTIETAGQGKHADDIILLYGHLDKQPEMEGWDADKGPWKPVLKEDRLYGRGSVDNGYAVFSIITAIKELQENNIPHARCVVLIESSEEGGSSGLPEYMELLKDRIGDPDLIVCLDSGCGNYNQLWLTTSLRGAFFGGLKVSLISEGVHSGNAGGIAASSFRVLRGLLDRIENVNTGEVIIKELNVDIPSLRKQQAEKAASVLGDNLAASYPFHKGVKPVFENPFELILNRSWRPSLSYIAADGFPKPENAGNVLRPFSMLDLSFRLPPTIEADTVGDIIKAVLEKDPPYNAEVFFEKKHKADGWNSPVPPRWLEDAIENASQTYFGKEPVYMGEGGSVPFMNILSKMFPKAHFVVTGAMGPHSNAHGPNEFLHIPTAIRISCCLVHILAEHSKT